MYRSRIERTGEWIEKIGRDGREFAHTVENLRDSLLNGGENIWFTIAGPGPAGRPQYGENGCVAKRVIADDGTGMSLDVIKNVWSDVSVSGTNTMFETDIDPKTGDVTIRTVPTPMDSTARGDKYHTRNGIGGRGSLSHWNKLGVVMITVQDGAAYMTQSFRDGKNDFGMREWIDSDGRKTVAIAPYTEPDVWDRNDIHEDITFATIALVRAGTFATEEEAHTHIAAMGEDDTVPNPMAGYEWDGLVVPKWIIDDYKDGVAYRADGTRAHGTIKVLMGDSPSDQTALIGDPDYLGEREHTKYHGFGNHFFLDLSAWNVYVTTLAKPKSKDRSFTLKGITGKYAYYDGMPTAHELIDPTQKGGGRRQEGALALRVSGVETAEDEDDEASAEKSTLHKAYLDLSADGYGEALVVFRQTPKKPSGANFWGSTRSGIIAAVYNGEIHGIKDEDVETADWQFRAMGIPTAFPEVRDRVSVFLFLPLATETTDGVFQTMARDRLRWKGRDDLPMGGTNGISTAVQRALEEQAPWMLAALNAAAPKSTAANINMDHVKKLWDEAPGLAPKDVPVPPPGLVADKDGDHEGVDVRPTSGKPEKSNPPLDCPYAADFGCTDTRHGKDCPLRKEDGGDPKDKVLDANADGGPKRRGRQSKAEAKSGEDDKTKTEEGAGKVPEPPTEPVIVFIKEAVDDKKPEIPAVFVKSDALPSTGVLTVNQEHVLVKRLYGLARKAGRSEADTDRLTTEWIKTQLAGVILGTLSVKDTELFGRVKEDYVALGQRLDKPDVWIGVLGGLLFRDESLLTYLRSKGVRKAPPRKKITAAAA